MHQIKASSSRSVATNINLTTISKGGPATLGQPALRRNSTELAELHLASALAARQAKGRLEVSTVAVELPHKSSSVLDAEQRLRLPIKIPPAKLDSLHRGKVVLHHREEDSKSRVSNGEEDIVGPAELAGGEALEEAGEIKMGEGGKAGKKGAQGDSSGLRTAIREIARK